MLNNQNKIQEVTVKETHFSAFVFTFALPLVLKLREQAEMLRQQGSWVGGRCEEHRVLTFPIRPPPPNPPTESCSGHWLSKHLLFSLMFPLIRLFINYYFGLFLHNINYFLFLHTLIFFCTATVSCYCLVLNTFFKLIFLCKFADMWTVLTGVSIFPFVSFLIN